ncbi:bifunctional adenosylcobinamide kinase/adenosylcobinamide-phosphate guanylyltransferase [Cumulibacter manganitolerans]|uniref:bifunctional adenosylcobinamide kinase/adenosylcobinamide-phosphate guanylyltransferase n=1 Tax=Cumulibacter manganitolerans TaxID=1884992 RepID=UPI0012963FEF|nr:bifunctional adenosylcobinamide kinase/adenosylcobinamide-phosphate guanylyltransferase [Cumulibacter manganitolerans]
MTGAQPAPGPLRTLVIGGARSGKSREAERLLATATDVTYIATSYPRSEDPEWVQRVDLHRRRRPAHWTTVESLDLAGLLRAHGGPLLVDCLTLWLTRVMDRHDAWDDAAWDRTGAAAVQAEVDALVAAWRTTRRRVVAVTNEVGQGLVPAQASLRRFRDEMGRLNAAIAAESDDVRLAVAGRILRI